MCSSHESSKCGWNPNGRQPGWGTGPPRYHVRVADDIHLSQAAFDRLHAEHHDLTTRGRIDIARKIQTARELGDLSENGDYHAAKEEQGKMEGRIIHLAGILDLAVVVETDSSGTVVAHGSVVSIAYEDDEEHETYLIGSIEERHDQHEVISPTSPLGSALLGAEVGDTVGFQAPGGELQVSVVEIHT